MGYKGSRLTVGDRILLLLIHYTRFRGELQAPIDVTQDGIAKNLGIIRSAVPRAVGSLMNKGLVEEGLAHIEGLTRRRKVYMLTDEGIMKSRELSDIISSEKVELIKEGEKRVVTIGDLMKEGSVDLENISDVLSSGKLDLDRTKEKEEDTDTKGKTSYIHSLNPPEIFLGRDREIKELTEAMRSPKRRITVVYGIAGVGKTTLGWKITQLLASEMNIFYIDLKEWTSLSYVLKELSSFFSRSGWNGLKELMETNREPGIETVSDLLGNIPGKLPVLVIFDDLHRAPEEIDMFLSSFKDRLTGKRNLNLIVLSRKRATFYDIRDVRIKNLIGEMELLGFDRQTSRKLLTERGFKENEVDAIIDSTGGHPLALVLVEREGYNFDIGDFDQFLREEIFNKLERTSLRILGILSLSRLQLEEGDLSSMLEVEKEVLTKLMDQHLIFSTPGGYVIHDLIKDQAIRILSSDEREECHRMLADLFRDKLLSLGFHQEAEGVVPPYPFGIEDETGLGPVPLYVTEEVHHLIGAGRVKETLPVMIESFLQMPSKDLLKEHRDPIRKNLPKSLSHVEKAQKDLIEMMSEVLDGDNEKALKILENLSKIKDEDPEDLRSIKECARIWKPYLEERVNGPEKALNEIKKIDLDKIPERLRYYFLVTRASLRYKTGDHEGASKAYREFLDTLINNEDLPVQLKDAITDALKKAEEGSIQVATDNFQKIMELTNSNRDTLKEELPYVDVDHHLLSAIYSLYHGRK